MVSSCGSAPATLAPMVTPPPEPAEQVTEAEVPAPESSPPPPVETRVVRVPVIRTVERTVQVEAEPTPERPRRALILVIDSAAALAAIDTSALSDAVELLARLLPTGTALGLFSSSGDPVFGPERLAREDSIRPSLDRLAGNSSTRDLDRALDAVNDAIAQGAFREAEIVLLIGSDLGLVDPETSVRAGTRVHCVSSQPPAGALPPKVYGLCSQSDGRFYPVYTAWDVRVALSEITAALRDEALIVAQSYSAPAEGIGLAVDRSVRELTVLLQGDAGLPPITLKDPAGLEIAVEETLAPEFLSETAAAYRLIDPRPGAWSIDLGSSQGGIVGVQVSARTDLRLLPPSWDQVVSLSHVEVPLVIASGSRQLAPTGFLYELRAGGALRRDGRGGRSGSTVLLRLPRSSFAEADFNCLTVRAFAGSDQLEVQRQASFCGFLETAPEPDVPPESTDLEVTLPFVSARLRFSLEGRLGFDKGDADGLKEGMRCEVLLGAAQELVLAGFVSTLRGGDGVCTITERLRRGEFKLSRADTEIRIEDLSLADSMHR